MFFLFLSLIAGLSFMPVKSTALSFDPETTQNCFLENEKSVECCQTRNFEKNWSSGGSDNEDCSQYEKAAQSQPIVPILVASGATLTLGVLALVWILRKRRSSRRKQ